MGKERKNLQKLIDDMNEVIFEREEVITGCAVAVLAQKHCFLIGPPGTAKTHVINTFCRATGLKFFDELGTKYTTPEEIFGPYRISELKKDNMERNTEGYMPDADVVFIDEIFKASSSILTSTLRITDETRSFRNGARGFERTPLMSLFSASNELPEDPAELGALWDRLHIRFVVDSIQDENNFVQMLTGSGNPVESDLTPEDVKKMQSEVPKVKFDTATAAALSKLRNKLASEGHRISDRRWRECVPILKAYAYVLGHDEVSVEHFSFLKHVLWDEPDQRSAVGSTITNFAAPSLREAFRLYDAAKAAYDQVKDSTEMVEIGQVIKQLQDVETEKLPALKSHPRIDEMIDEIATIRKKMLQEKMGIMFRKNDR